MKSSNICFCVLFFLIVLCSCEKNNTDEMPEVSNKVKVIDESGRPLENVGVFLRLQLLEPNFFASAKTNSDGIAEVKYEDFSLEDYYDYMQFVLFSEDGDKVFYGYTPYDGPNIDHTITVYDKEILTVEILTKDLGEKVYPLREPIDVEMIFHSNIYTASLYDLSLSSPYGRYQVYNEPEDKYEITSFPSNYVDRNGRLKFQYIPLRTEGHIRIQYRDIEFNQFDIFFDISAE